MIVSMKSLMNGTKRQTRDGWEEVSERMEAASKSKQRKSQVFVSSVLRCLRGNCDLTSHSFGSQSTLAQLSIDSFNTGYLR
jgi:hypothetical protein